MTNKEIIKELGCRALYAQKIIDSCNGDPEAIKELVTFKKAELIVRPGIEEYKPCQK